MLRGASMSGNGVSEKRILVADDDDAIRTLLATVLRRRGYHVDTARNGQEALAQITACRYVVVLLDLMMPLVSGHEVLTWLAPMPRAQRPLVIVLTAGLEPRSLDPDIVSGTLRKPFDIELLVDTISACIKSVPSQKQDADCPEPGSESDAPEVC